MKLIHEFDEVHDSQQMFRKILKAMSNPLVKVDISKEVDKISGNYPTQLSVALTLVDNETTFCTFANKELDEDILSFTLSKKVSCNIADFIFANSEEELLQAVETAKCGTLLNPHKSATIVVKIPTEKDCSLTMYGAGIKDTISLETNSYVKKAIEKRDEMYFEYPTGLDFIFINDNKELFAIPRLTRLVSSQASKENK